METAKYSVWIIWIGGVAAILFGEGRVATLGHVAVWATLTAHLLEFVAMRSTLEKAGGSMSTHFVQTVIYELFHWLPIRRQMTAGVD